MSKKFLQQNADGIAKLVDTIKRNSNKLAVLIQLACIQVIGHAMKHGDVTLATRLVEAVGSHNRAAVAAFLEIYGPFAWSKSEKRMLFFRRPKLVFDEAYIEALPSWESAKKPAEIRSVYDVDAEAEKFLKRMEKLAADPSITLKDADLLKQLVETRNRYVAQKYLAPVKITSGEPVPASK